VLNAAVATEVLAAVVSEDEISSVVIVTMVAILPARTVVLGILIEKDTSEAQTPTRIISSLQSAAI
jgi:hypothetical protein